MNWHDYFTYDAETGMLSWRQRPREHFLRKVDMDRWNTRWSGGQISNVGTYGYIHVFIASHGSVKKRICVGVHRIIWEMHNGPIPDGMQIDHINRKRSDNRLRNLRLATVSQNHTNKTVQKNNSSGHKGVHWSSRRSKWIASIAKDRKHQYLGAFDSADSAGAAYAAAATRIHQGFTPTNTKDE